MGSGAYEITTDVARLDLDVAARALDDWKGRHRDVVAKAFASSRVAVALDDTGATAGFARAVTDGCTHAWLTDVWVEVAHRGQGLGSRLVATLVDAPDLKDIRRWMLRSSVVALPIYERLGFVRATNIERLLERRGTTL